jgi:hypothetical protein
MDPNPGLVEGSRHMKKKKKKKAVKAKART